MAASWKRLTWKQVLLHKTSSCLSTTLFITTWDLINWNLSLNWLYNRCRLECVIRDQLIIRTVWNQRPTSPRWCGTFESWAQEFQPSPSSAEDDLLSFPLIVINHIWKNSHDRGADWWQNTRSHLLSECCQGQVDSRGRSWRVLVSPLSPSIIATPAHDSLRVWAGKIILPIIHIDLMAAAAKWNAFSPAPYKPQGSDTKWSYFLLLELGERFEQEQGWRGSRGVNTGGNT